MIVRAPTFSPTASVGPHPKIPLGLFSIPDKIPCHSTPASCHSCLPMSSRASLIPKMSQDSKSPTLLEGSTIPAPFGAALTEKPRVYSANVMALGGAIQNCQAFRQANADY